MKLMKVMKITAAALAAAVLLGGCGSAPAREAESEAAVNIESAVAEMNGGAEEEWTESVDPDVLTESDLAEIEASGARAE